jgi:hypothetical protein
VNGKLSMTFRKSKTRYKYQTIVGHEYLSGTKCENLVIAVVQYRQSLERAIEGLIQTRQALGTGWEGSIQLWNDIHPIDDLAAQISCFSKKTGRRLYALATADFQETYVPPPDDRGHREVLPIFGLTLAEVWEYELSKKFEYEKTSTPDCQHTTVFPSAVFSDIRFDHD